MIKNKNPDCFYSQNWHELNDEEYHKSEEKKMIDEIMVKQSG